MIMLCLFLFLFASQLPLASPFMITNEQSETGVTTMSSKISKTASQSTDPKTQPFPSEAPSLGHHQAKSGDNHAEISSNDPAKRNGPHKTAKEAVNAGCRKEDLHVNTSDLGLSAKFIRPESFNAYQCRGKCSLTQGKTFTLHSLLEAFVNKKGIKTDGDGCCVPTKLRPLSVIYYVEERGFFERYTFQDLIVEDCGCY